MLIKHGEEGSWHQPSAEAYRNEAELRDLLQESPDVLPRVERAVAVTELGLGASALYVAIVESNGDITLVECKLSTSREIRRQIVGQILEYGARLKGLSYEDFDARFRARGRSALAELIRDVAESDWDEEEFRFAVGRNLERGRFRLMVAVDEISPELKAIVEFLNASTREDLVVLALELRLVADGSGKILFPRVYGEEFADAKKRGAANRWTEADFLAAIDERTRTKEGAAGLRSLYEWAERNAEQVIWGTGENPAVSVWFRIAGESMPLLYFGTRLTGPAVVVMFQMLARRGLVQQAEKLALSLREIPKSASALEGLETAGFRRESLFRTDDSLAEPTDRDRFVAAIEGVIDRSS